MLNHPWFHDVDWYRLKMKHIKSPFIPYYNPDDYQDQLNMVPELPIPSETLLLLKKEAIQSNCFVSQICSSNIIMMGLKLTILCFKCDDIIFSLL